MTGRNTLALMAHHASELMSQGWTRHDAENEAYDLFIGADERRPEIYSTPTEDAEDDY
jgi:hypothetical protein